ncbi:MAG: hypothetical protein OXS30_07325 [Chloroflexota bacterium]|nr:hypothetical protein [Chloroflexota bacterium]
MVNEWLVAAGVVLTPIVVVVLGWWFNRQQQDRARLAALEQQLQGDRVQVYRDILEPFAVMFTSDVA